MLRLQRADIQQAVVGVGLRVLELFAIKEVLHLGRVGVVLMENFLRWFMGNCLLLHLAYAFDLLFDACSFV